MIVSVIRSFAFSVVSRLGHHTTGNAGELVRCAEQAVAGITETGYDIFVFV